MPAKSSKIERSGHSETVQKLMVNGVDTRAEMTEILRNEYGLDVSEATVGRFMRRLRSSASEEAFQTITDHVNETLPADLDAIEEMEAMCLEWSRQAGLASADRIAEAACEIQRNISEFTAALMASDDPEKTTRVIIKKCLQYILADDRRQEQRLSAMRQAAKLIEIKLSKAGLLDDDQKGRILILKNDYENDGPAGGNSAHLRLIGGDGANG